MVEASKPPPVAADRSRGDDRPVIGDRPWRTAPEPIRDRWHVAAIPAGALIAIGAGLLCRWLAPLTPWGDRVSMLGLIVTGAPVVWRSVRAIFVGRFASDLVAMLAIVGSVALGHPFAGLVIVLMQSGGEALERYAEGRASAAVQALEDSAPRHAHRLVDGTVEDLAAERVAVGDTLLVRPGELVPCDGLVVAGRSHVDTSRLTGESVPVSAVPGTRVMSGAINGEGALTVTATAVSRESQYARIVELVRSAQASKAPLQRVADRYAVWFTPLTLAVCLIAYAIAHDPVRVLAVLVVATPCPLILAVPVAIIGGINRAARRQIIVRHGEGLEQLARVTVGVFDKTGTLTVGMPAVARVATAPGRQEDDVLRLAAGVEQASGHLLARSITDMAVERGLRIPEATNVTEVPGRGVEGTTNGHRVVVGSRSLLVERDPPLEPVFAAFHRRDEGLSAYVSINGQAAGVIEFADQQRPGLPQFFADLRRLGIRRTMLLSGDREEYAREVAAAVGISEVQAELLPEGKVRVVRALVEDGASVLMVGDGTNDAPALSVATVGVALAGHGGGITAESADVVILTNDVTRVVDAIRISRRTLRIAHQSIWVGLGLSAVAMAIAAAGHIPPAIGALLQEGIDVAVILNALRASA